MYMEKKIYVVRGGYGDEGEILAALSTPEKAEEYIDLCIDKDVYMEGCMLDGALPEPKFAYYRVTFNLGGDFAEIIQIWPAECVDEEVKESCQALDDFVYEFLLGAHGKKEALATARDRALYLRDHWREEFPYLHHKALYKSKYDNRVALYYVLYNFVTHEIVGDTPFRTFVRIEEKRTAGTAQ